MSHSREVACVAVEDRFVVIRLAEMQAVLPDTDTVETFATALRTSLPDHKVVLDLRGIEEWLGTYDLPRDVMAFSDAFAGLDADILCPTPLIDTVKLILPGHKNYIATSKDDVRLRYEPIASLHHVATISSFSSLEQVGLNRDDYATRLGSTPLPPNVKYLQALHDGCIQDQLKHLIEVAIGSSEMYERDDIVRELFLKNEFGEEDYVDIRSRLNSNDNDYIESGLDPFMLVEVAQGEIIAKELLSRAGNSMLTKYVFSVDSGISTILPYQAHSLCSIETASRGLLLARPAVLAATTNMILREELAHFEHLLQNYDHETQITQFLEDHPSFIKMLGYRTIYPQVVLERDDGSSLRPDFILEPLDDEWCDILECKLPDVGIVVGADDRKTFSAKVHAMASQMREYSAYFEDPKLRARIEDVYGFKCYLPKMKGLIGQDVRTLNPYEQRRMETSYPDMQVISFDKLVKLARRRLLV